MRVVISGGLGYVGGRLSKYFAERQHEVIALSRQAGRLPVVDFPPGMQVLHPVSLAQGSGLKGADVFIHLAAMNEHECVKFPEKAIEVNITGTLRWLDLCIEAGVSRFIYFSTAHVYGKPLEGFYDEATLTRPVHPYAVTHKCAEDYVLAYAKERGMSNFVIRLTNAFGGPAFPTADRWTLLVNDLCQSAVRDGRMTLLSDGLQQRDFVCLEDVCAATNHLANLREHQTAGEIFNLGGSRSLSVWDMAQEVKSVAEKFLRKPVGLVRQTPSSLAAGTRLKISIEKLLDTGYVLNDNIDYEISSTIEYFMNH